MKIKLYPLIFLFFLSGWFLPYLILSIGNRSYSTGERYAVADARGLHNNPLQKIIVTGFKVTKINKSGLSIKGFGDMPKDFDATVRVYTLFGIKYADVRVGVGGAYRTN